MDTDETTNIEVAPRTSTDHNIKAVGADGGVTSIVFVTVTECGDSFPLVSKAVMLYESS